MIIIFSALIVLCVSMDGFSLGYAFWHSKLKINTLMFAIIGAVAAVVSGITMKLGNLFFGRISERDCAVLCSFFLFILAYIAANEQICHKVFDNQNSFTVALLNGLLISIDAAVAALSLSLEGISHIVLPIFLGFAQFALITCGYKLAHYTFSQKIKTYIPVFSSVILAALAILRLI